MHRLTIAFVLCVLGSTTAFAQASRPALSVKASAGVAYGPALAWTYDDAFDVFDTSSSTFSGTTLSLYGDLTLADRVIGRAQGVILQAGSIDEDVDIGGSLLATGGLGYVFFGRASDGPARTFHLPVLLAAGYGRVETSGGDTDASAHFGVLLSPHYYVTRHLAVEVTYHYLPGRSINGSSAIGANAFTLGLRASL